MAHWTICNTLAKTRTNGIREDAEFDGCDATMQSRKKKKLGAKSRRLLPAFEILEKSAPLITISLTSAQAQLE